MGLRAQRGALSAAEVCEALGMSQLKGRKWHVQSAVATRGEGLYEGLDWCVLCSIKHVGWAYRPCGSAALLCQSRALPLCSHVLLKGFAMDPFCELVWRIPCNDVCLCASMLMAQ